MCAAERRWSINRIQYFLDGRAVQSMKKLLKLSFSGVFSSFLCKILCKYICPHAGFLVLSKSVRIILIDLTVWKIGPYRTLFIYLYHHTENQNLCYCLENELLRFVPNNCQFPSFLLYYKGKVNDQKRCYI